MDERSQEIISRAMGITLGLAYFGLLIYCVIKYVVTKDITSITWELMIVIIIPLSITWFARKDESLLIPKMSGTTGKELPTDQNKFTKNIRKKYYLLDSIGLATFFLILTIIDAIFIQKTWEHILFFSHLSQTVNIIITLAIEFVISVIIFYIISYIWEEWKTRKYHKKLAELEDINE